MKKHLPIILLLLVFIMGAGVFLYPVVSNILYERNATREIEQYNEEVREMDDKEIETQRSNAAAYNDRLGEIEIEDPFREGQTEALTDDYQSILDFDGVMAWLEIPVIDVKLPVYHGTSETVLKKGAGHMEESAFPIGRKGDHTVLTGHTGLASADLFSDLDKMEEGDIFLIRVLGENLAYEVEEILIVEPEDTSALLPVKGEDRVTLITCTPYGINSHRLLVRGIRTEYTEDMESIVRDDNRIINWQLLIGAGFILLWVVLFAAGRARKNKKEQQKKSLVPIATACLFLAGAAVLLYPYIRQWIYRQQAEELIGEFDEQDWEWSFEEGEEYNRNLLDNQELSDPFDFEDSEFDDDMFGYISVPAMDIRLPIYIGATQENLKKGAANLSQTSLPIGGTSTNAVLAAHRGYSSAAMFRDIEKVRKGDLVYITNRREELTYEVVEIKVINPTDVHEILIQEGRDLVTLITCHPYRYNYQRYVVYCERVPDE